MAFKLVNADGTRKSITSLKVVNADGTRRNATRLLRVAADGTRVQVWPTDLTVSPDYSFRNATPGAQISESFSVSGSTAGTWSISSTVFSLSSASGTGVTVSAAQNSGTHLATLTYTASDGRTSNATLEWTWGDVIA